MFFLIGEARGEAPSVAEMGDMTLAELLELEVSSATRTRVSQSDAPATVYLVTRDTIEARGYRTLADVLRDLPEVQVADKANEEAPTSVAVRGIAGVEKLLLLRDGSRTAAPSGRPEPLLQNYSLFDVERIEVILGPASALYGADAYAGIVNVITSRGGDLDGATLTGSWGMYGTTHDGAVWGDTFGPVQVALSAQVYHSNDVTLPDLYPDAFQGYLDYRRTGQLDLWGEPVDVQNTEWDMPIDAGSVGATVGLDDLEIRYFRSGVRFVPAYSATPSQTVFDMDRQRYVDEREVVAISHKYETGGRRNLRFETQVSRTSAHLDPQSGFTNLFTGYERRWKAEWGHLWSAQQFTHLEWSERTVASAAIAYENIVGMPKSTDLDRPYDPHLPIASQPARYPGTDLPIAYYVVDDHTLGGLLQLQSGVGEWARFTLGTRVDHNERYGPSVNPRAGVVLTPTPRVTTKLLYGEAFLSPTLFASYLHYGSFDCSAPDTCEGGFFHVPNPGLEPEKLRTGEVSTTVAFTDRLVGAVTVFGSHSSNRIDPAGPVRTGTFLGVDGVDLQTSVNRGTMTIWGGTARLEAQLELGPVSVLPDVAYTYTDGDIASDDVDGLPNTPPHAVKGGLGLAWGDLSVTPRVRVGSATLEGQGATVPAYGVVDLAVRYRELLGSRAPAIDVFGRATNLFDQRYALPPSVDLGGGFTMPQVPQDPLRVDLGVEVSF